ncbi:MULTISPECIES: Fur family transcriptional regulator [Sphingobacterium]|jgi:Fur family ferric uptake transcriptional regulator|uniref:Fur family transcriptional regulator n=1 Tax=Sphingobacterium TaxID=28453 RepID=UPI0004E5F79B|nr:MULTISPECIES: transcriptional regulator [Sphingobacterium]CDT09100.1 Fur family transcriptional regulator protein [Sphingobacterium sp. PM2-P1-29]SJN44919.1 Zinc uptake regulation protein ZUR [Sphingobacterium faecium PCAi_F2.5]HCU45543.1 transcriptional regulator [Sphingobacterium sp.]UPZ38597.1 transcriptional regulator [Sphingobacterium sp. PCS056]UXD70050.1 transcriptional regulator [Sphingobacterium faecium]
MNSEIENKLRDKNTKPTSMRILVYDFLASQHIALSLSEMESHFYPADRITLYRTLKTFEEKGIVHSIQENNTSKYILCHDDCNEETHKDWHLHFYCKICKQTTCRTDISFSSPINSAVRMDEVRFFAKGICENCMNETMQ